MPAKTSKRRNSIVIAVIILIFILFAVNLFNIQIINPRFDSDTVVSTVTVPVDAIRGEILDRNGQAFVKNKTGFSVEIHYVRNKTNNERNAHIMIEAIKKDLEGGFLCQPNSPINSI